MRRLVGSLGGLSGGLTVWWHEELKVEVLFSSKNFNHTVVCGEQFENVCLITFVYGPPCASEMDGFWKKLHELAPAQDKWLCVGDFNNILYQSEKWEGGISGFQGLFISFRTGQMIVIW